MSTQRYPTAEFRRMALAPSILAAIALLAGVALVDNGAYLFIQFVVSILALIVGFYAWQAKQWWWLPPLAAIAIVWNPVWPLAIDHDLLLALHYIASAVFIAAGLLIKVRNPDDKNQRPAK